MSTNRTRGDVVVFLGSLGEVNCRPTLRALSAIDDPKRGGPLPLIVHRLASFASLNDVVDIIYETQLDGENATPHSRDAIGEAVMSVGMDTLFEGCAVLLSSAWSTQRPNEESEGSEDEEGKASTENPTAGSPEVNGPRQPSLPLE